MWKGLLYQPLSANGTQEQTGPGDTGALPLCAVSAGVRRTLGNATPCLYEVGFFGELIEGVKHLAKKASHAIVKTAHEVVRCGKTARIGRKDY